MCCLVARHNLALTRADFLRLGHPHRHHRLVRDKLHPQHLHRRIRKHPHKHPRRFSRSIRSDCHRLQRRPLPVCFVLSRVELDWGREYGISCESEVGMAVDG